MPAGRATVQPRPSSGGHSGLSSIVADLVANERPAFTAAVDDRASPGCAPPVDQTPAAAPFRKAASLLGRFGIVKLWPDIKVAEDEVIARVLNSAAALGLECVIVDHTGVMINPPHLQMTQADLDFVIHLHFSTPKSYDIFSFVVLWNPLQFYHDFGYRRVTRHLLTHDDFLSCGSSAADDQIARMILTDPARDRPCFTLYHSASEPVLAPTLGDKKLFYSGINWERLGKGPSRHQSVLDELDLTGKLRIYGPRVLHGAKVWDGYASYQGSIPFDGASVIREINRAGIALVLSSESHVESELMSNRLFEALAGGAVVICDQNPFARRHFGDSLLYIDTKDPADEVAGQILRHIRWVEAEPQAALALARRAQALFDQSFRLDQSLRALYDGFAARHAHLDALGAPAVPVPGVTLFLLVPHHSAAVLEVQLANARSQRHAVDRTVLVIDAFEATYFRAKIAAAIAASGLAIDVVETEFAQRDAHGKRVRPVRLGRIVATLFTAAGPDRLFCVVAPNEQLFGNHITLMAGALSRTPGAGYAYSPVMLSYMDGLQKATYEVRETLDLFTFTRNFPVGCARFLFRAAAINQFVDVLLPYLDVGAFAGLACYIDGVSARRATMVIDIEHPFNVGGAIKDGSGKVKPFEERLREDHNVIRDVDPDRFDHAWRAGVPREPSPRDPSDAQSTEHLAPRTLYLDNLSRRNRQILLAQMVRSLPLPGFLFAMLRPFRPWRRDKPAGDAVRSDAP